MESVAMEICPTTQLTSCTKNKINKIFLFKENESNNVPFILKV